MQLADHEILHSTFCLLHILEKPLTDVHAQIDVRVNRSCLLICKQVCIFSSFYPAKLIRVIRGAYWKQIL